MVIAGVVSASLILRNPTGAEPPAPQPWPVEELPRHLYITGDNRLSVRVAFPFPLVATGDARIWEYHPGFPVNVVPASYRVEFAAVPVFPPMGEVIVVTGKAEFVADGKRRASGVPGYVRIEQGEVAK